MSLRMLSPPRPKFVPSRQESIIHHVDLKAEPAVQDLDHTSKKNFDRVERQLFVVKGRPVGPAPSFESLLVNRQTSSDLANSPFAMADGRVSPRNSSIPDCDEAEGKMVADC